LLVKRLLVAGNANYALTGSDVTIRNGPLVTADRGGGGSSAVRQRRKYRHVTKKLLEELLFSKEEEQPPPPTPARIKAVQEEIISAGLLSPVVARTVKRAVVNAYKPDVTWRELARDLEAVRRAAELEQELEDEDEFLMLA
jgi:hypothetical protein